MKQSIFLSAITLSLIFCSCSKEEVRILRYQREGMAGTAQWASFSMAEQEIAIVGEGINTDAITIFLDDYHGRGAYSDSIRVKIGTLDNGTATYYIYDTGSVHIFKHDKEIIKGNFSFRLVNNEIDTLYTYITDGYFEISTN